MKDTFTWIWDVSALRIWIQTTIVNDSQLYIVNNGIIKQWTDIISYIKKSIIRPLLGNFWHFSNQNIKELIYDEYLMYACKERG